MTAAPLSAPVQPSGTSPARPPKGKGASDIAGLFALLLAGTQPVQANVAKGASPGTIGPEQPNPVSAAPALPTALWPPVPAGSGPGSPSAQHAPAGPDPVLPDPAAARDQERTVAATPPTAAGSRPGPEQTASGTAAELPPAAATENGSTPPFGSPEGAAPKFSTLVTRSAAVSTYSPGGARANTLYRIDQQGLLQSSNSPTDVTIDGAGFFVINDRADGSGEQLYTRAGSFEQDFLGDLRNNAGFYLPGWALDANEQVITSTSPARSTCGSSTASPRRPRMWSSAPISMPPRPPSRALTPLATWPRSMRPAGSRACSRTWRARCRCSIRSAALTISRSLSSRLRQRTPGTSKSMRIPPRSRWGTIPMACWRAAPSRSVATAPSRAPTSRPITPRPWPGRRSASTGLDASGPNDSSIALDLGTIGTADGLSQFSSDYNISFVIQNGAEVGELNGVTIDQEGFVIASFTNGATQKIYKLPIATFANPLALDPRTGNVYGQTAASGEFNLRDAGRGGAGMIAPSALEGANVDLAEEFTKMIVTQRAYSANARVITTTDEMLDELIRISR